MRRAVASILPRTIVNLLEEIPNKTRVERASTSEPIAADMVSSFLDVFRSETQALKNVQRRLESDHESITRVCTILLAASQGTDRGQRVIVSGVGKAGLVARKVCATLSSTGTAATFLHPVDALHGDLGFVRQNDCG